MSERHDFDEKIAGASKDLWAGWGIILSDPDEMSGTERNKDKKTKSPKK